MRVVITKISGSIEIARVAGKMAAALISGRISITFKGNEEAEDGIGVMRIESTFIVR